MSSLPEPLLTAVRGAAQVMARGGAGTSGKGSTAANYVALVKAHESDVLAFMRAEVEEESEGRYSLRLADPTLFRSLGQLPPGYAVLFHMAVCTPSRPDGTIKVLSSAERLYAVYAPNAVELEGISVTKAK